MQVIHVKNNKIVETWATIITNYVPKRDHLPLLLILFAASGAAALIYEIVWFQLLQLVIGSTAISLAVLLGTFMGGMCAGSVALPRVLARTHHPLRTYAALALDTTSRPLSIRT